MSNVDDLDFEFDVTLDEMPAPAGRAGRKSKFIHLINAARDQAVAAAKSKKRAPDGGSPWIVYPKDRTPTVTTQTLYDLRGRYGPESEHAKTNDGEFFEFELTDRVQYGKNNSSAKGLLWVRKGAKK